MPNYFHLKKFDYLKIVEIAAAETWDIDPRREECNASHDKIGSPSCVGTGKEKILAILMGDSHASAIASSLGTAASLTLTQV